MLSLTQGDGIVIKTPEGKFLMVDGGGSPFYDVGTNTVLPYLHHRGIRNLAMMINTHPDEDHIGGLEPVARAVKVQYIGLPAALQNEPAYETLMEIAEAKAIPVIGFSRGQQIPIDDEITIKVLHPAKEDHYHNPSGNNQSLVLEIIYKGFSIVLTRDIEEEGMLKMLSQQPIGPVTVVKVPHHGSHSSVCPPFYDQLQPYYGVISVGFNNRFGHPHPEVLSVIEDHHIQILRTDLDGAVTIQTNGSRLQIETVNSGQ